MLHDYGIPYPKHAVAQSSEEATAIAQRLGYPVVLKVISPDVLHKSDVGGVVVGLESAADVVRAYAQILETVHHGVPGARIEGMLVCQHAPAGLEVIVGALQDEMFGPALMFGLGGVYAEVLNDISFRVIPVRRQDAEEMVREIQGYPLVGGTRGHPGLDGNALIDLLLSVSRMMTDRVEIQELDLNPVRLFEHGLLVLDARVMTCGPG